MPQDRMTDLMTDVVLLESGNQVQFNFSAIPDNIWKRDYTAVCKKHGTDTTNLRLALDWYHKHPEQFSKVMEQVIVRIQKRQLEPQKLQP